MNSFATTHNHLEESQDVRGESKISFIQEGLNEDMEGIDEEVEEEQVHEESTEGDEPVVFNIHT